MDNTATTTTQQTGRPGLLVPLAVACATVVFFFTMLVPFWNDYRTGGNNWKQGDWLISSLNEPIRRGPFGSALITVSDMLAISPLTLTFVLQLLLLGLLLIVTALIFRALVRRDRVYLLLLISPGFYLVFWAADPQGSLRKELLAFCAMGLVLTYPLYRSKVVVLLGCLLFVIAAIGHELNVLLYPAFVAVTAIIGTGAKSRRFFVVCGLLVSIGSVAALGYAITFSRVADVATICAPLLERGLSAEICKGAIGFLNQGTDAATALASEKMSTGSIVGFFAAGYLAALLPIVFFISRLARPGLPALALMLTALPILPLYIVAVDWGRWISLHITSAVFILTALGLTGRLAITKRISDAGIIIFTLAAVLLTPNHETGLVIGGVVRRVVALTYWLLGI
ncbi:hypothetical protein [Rhizobium sp. AAP43]|uniref:hypothetical protein n=1 Tax=Rhizobium sp. AAP43 TaxID=1523420 RepID=UPI0006B8A740|nr:hypothetical protein [Rhizobium sp. AAP43]KPF43119.1 hypothetical protein IP76_15220 [Rhizobium sp. AAP43]